MSRHAKTEEVEQGNADGDRDPRVHDRRGIDHLVPSTSQVEERGSCGNGRDRKDREQHQD